MVLRNWLRRFIKGDPVNKVCDTRNMNRIANILEDLEVFGTNGIRAAINKPTNAEGMGWSIQIDGGLCAKKLPFDIEKLPSGNLGVYMPDISTAVKIDDGNNVLLCDTLPTFGDFIDLGSTATVADLYVEVIDNGGYPEYHWGVNDTGDSGGNTKRTVVVLQIGWAGDEIHQLWHGNIHISDCAWDGRSINRDNNENGDSVLQLLDFRDATAITSDPWTSKDYVVRHGPGGSYGTSYQVKYLDGTVLRDAIISMIDQRIADALSDLLDPTEPPGAQLIALLSGYFQPLVSTSTTTDGTDSGAYVGILQANGKTWAPAPTPPSA